MSKAHRRLGVTTFLPTLITDTAEKTRAAIEAVVDAIAAQVPGIAGLHLEGPHLSVARKGAHVANLIHTMNDKDLNSLLQAADRLPVLKITVAPENVTEDQVARLARAGVLVSLGHSDADYATCCRYFEAGARCATHLFNAMSQMGSREPGLAGAALAHGAVATGLIADAVHVHPATMRTAWRAKSGSGGVFLVSDAMAVAGTDLDRFDLGGRQVLRDNGALRLEDGTLAGADLDLATAIRVMTEEVGVSLVGALQAASTLPCQVIGRHYGFGNLCNVVRLRTEKRTTAECGMRRLHGSVSGIDLSG
jgi:N-acetylglucosamine-6-phosphate deacetylase